MRLILAAIPILGFQFDDCRYSAPREATVDAAAATSMYVSAGAGNLRIEGRPGLRQARIRATACASDRDLLDDIQLTATRSGDQVRVHANDDDLELRNRQYARLNVIIEVPENLAAEIQDGGGDVEIAGIGQLDLNDGSGEIILQDLRGDVEIEDGSGEITVSGVQGNVRIHDGSGEIDLHDVVGSVVISDGSGEITITRVGRDVTVSDSSGSIEVDEVGGSFTVRDDSSGDVDYRRVKGQVRIPRSNEEDWRSFLRDRLRL
jgi:hypothetical protein